MIDRGRKFQYLFEGAFKTLFKIMLTISYTTFVTLCDLFESCQKCSKHNSELFKWGRPFFKMHALLNYGLGKVLCRMQKSIIFATLYKVICLAVDRAAIWSRMLQLATHMATRCCGNIMTSPCTYQGCCRYI